MNGRDILIANPADCVRRRRFMGRSDKKTAGSAPIRRRLLRADFLCCAQDLSAARKIRLLRVESSGWARILEARRGARR
jgi:hypothetical protein